MAKSNLGIICFCAVLAWNSAAGQNLLDDGLSVRKQVENTYVSQIGVKEVGANAGPQVEAYLATTGLRSGHAWCAAFVAWVLTQNNVSNPKSAWSPAWFPVSRVVWQRNGRKIRLPLPGDVFGIYYTNKSRIAHVGFIHRYSDNITITVEGNTNDTGSREGDGVYMKRRPSRQLYKVASYINE